MSGYTEHEFIHRIFEEDYFRSGFESGVNRLCWSPGGSLMVGQLIRNSECGAGAGTRIHGLQRLDFTGKVPFKIHSVSVRTDGFVLRFTKPCALHKLSQNDLYLLKSYTYYYFNGYGSSEIDRREELLRAIEPAPDGLEVRLIFRESLRKGRVYEFLIDGLSADDGSVLLNPGAWYTLNTIPD